MWAFLFYMGNKQQEAQTQALYNQLLSQITALQNPKTNEAQNYLTTAATEGADWLKKGEYDTLPKGLFFNFKMPGEQLDQYKKYADVNQGGTFALSNGGDGRSKATGVQSKYLSDKFARDASQNYQDNIGQAAGNIQGALAQASGASSQNSSSIINALGGMYSSLINKPKSPSPWGAILGAAGQIGAAAVPFI